MPKFPPAGVTAHGAALHTDVQRELILLPRPYTGGGGDFHTLQQFCFYQMVTGDSGACYFKGKVPDDFVSFVSAKVVWLGYGGTAGEDWRMRIRSAYGAEGETYTHVQESPSDQVLDVTALNTFYETDTTLSLTGLAKGDYIGIYVGRKGLESEDTYGGSINVLMVIVRYMAEQ